MRSVGHVTYRIPSAGPSRGGEAKTSSGHPTCFYYLSPPCIFLVQPCSSAVTKHRSSKQASTHAGSAAIVGAGVVPFALGNDSGGSIRVPAACCGAVGLFSTHSRIPSQNGTKHYKSTTTSDGPIAGTAADAALVYALMAARSSETTGTVACLCFSGFPF